jgi:hypothetical protein
MTTAEVHSRSIHVIIQAVSSKKRLQTTRWHALQLKLLSAPVSCPTSGGCDTVLSSGYASVVGVPLPFLGTPTCLCPHFNPTPFAQSPTNNAAPIPDHFEITSL